MRERNVLLLAAIASAVVFSQQAFAQTQKVRVATAFLGLWDTSQPTFCKDRGEFAKAGLDVDIITTRGGSELIQAVVAGSADIAYSVGVNAAIAGFVGGSKTKIISAEFKGQNDTYFYVPVNSPIKSIADLKGKSVAYPRPGGASDALLQSLKQDRNLDFKMVATGGLDATFTQTMTKQVDVGYSFPPYILAQVEKGEVRVLFAGDEVKSQRDLTQRVTIAGEQFLKDKRDVAAKFLKVLDGCIDWAYANPEQSLQAYAALNKIDLASARKGMTFYKRETLAFGPPSHFETVMGQAVTAKFIEKPLTADQMKALIDIVYTPGQ
ncbi:MAG: ABC transporter substrate-binding protein [Proteobacteria bacterium]|nr:ABC transporter substrate-binding protein [Pseudomonadota bacterium]